METCTSKDDVKKSLFCHHLVYYGEYMVFIPANIQKEWFVEIIIGMIKKVIHFNGKNPSFYNMM